ncbi:MAG TPA: polysaccharide biosynthesis tyrosine autokinase [Propionibacteriaceae bacterium]
MDLRDYLVILRRRWLSLVIVTVAVLAVTSAVTLLLPKQFTATTRLFFAVQGGDSVTDLAQGSTFTEKQMVSYAEVATSPLVLDKVITQLKLATTAEALAQQVTATAPTNTVILEISATNPSNTQAARIVNSIGEQLTSVTGELSPPGRGDTQAVKATILAKALTPLRPSSPVVPRNLGLGLALGLLLGIGTALLRHLMDTKVRTTLDVEAITDTAVLGVIPFDSAAPTHPVTMHDDPLAARSEAVRRLRTNLQFVEVADQAKCILITSSIPGEGKSTTAMNLGVSLADAGLKVILIDADLRRPTLDKYLGLEGAVGLTTVLIGRAKAEDVVQQLGTGGLYVLPAGQVPPNPSELLGSKAMSALLADLAQTYDMVLLDSAPLLPVTDGVVLSKSVGGTLVVVGAERTNKSQLHDALESLSTVGANVMGVVLNKAARRDTTSYVYYKGYGGNYEQDGKMNPDATALPLDQSVAPVSEKTPSGSSV